MVVKNIALDELVPYERNAKKHDSKQIERIAKSLDAFGWMQPVVVDRNSVIVVGHGRVLGAKKSKKWNNKPVPCVMADELTDDEIKAYRLADNRLNESEWDADLLALDLSDISFDMGDFGFDIGEFNSELDEYEQKKKEFEERMAAGELSEDDEEYQEFVKKFEAKRTTDDCYTPPIVYEAVADYVSEKYGLKKSNFVRPFVPQGDYRSEKYKNSDVVVDNPPFSIISEIINFYQENGIKFFLFAPHMTTFSSSSSSAASCLCCGASIIYENGANVLTSFVTNLEDCAFRTCPDLYQRVKKANEENLKKQKKSLPKYSYPLNVVTAASLIPYTRYGIELEVSKDECYFVRRLDSQKESGKELFGGGYLISDKKKAEREKAEREKAEREKAEREKAEREKAERWELSARELEIISRLK